MKNLSIRTFLIFTLSISSFFFVVFFITTIAQLSNTFKYVEYSNKLGNSYLMWTKAVQSQEVFLTTYNTDAVFFQTEQNRYLKRQQILASNSSLLIDSLSLLKITNNLELNDEMQLYKDNLNKSIEVFSEISHTIFLRGSKKTGIIGNCFVHYNSAITSVSDSKIEYYLNKMNENFLTYLHLPNLENYQEFLDYFTSLNSYIRQQQIIRDTSTIDTTQFIAPASNISSDFISSVNDFKQSFGKLINIDRKLFLNDQANLMLQWSTMNEDFDEIYGKTVSVVQNSVKDRRDKTRKVIVVMVFIFFFFFTIINIFLPRIIARRIEELRDFIEPLKVGKIPDTNIEAKYFKEIIKISNIISRVVLSLKEASAFAAEIGKGNFSFNYAPVSDSDELGNSLILLRDNLQKAKEEEEKRKEEDKIREWVNIGIAKFSDVLRQSNKDIHELSSLIIKDLVHYLDANQGGMFIVNDEANEKKFVELVASYAYSKERKKKKDFLFGEGLIGTCAVERATIYMTEIPEDYISITSGLGGANPRSLLIVPLKFEENVLGVLEIASFNKLEKYQIEFVEKIAESIASTISIAKINERTVNLLDRAKVEAEQRSLKEEELRQNLEELEATQERAGQREIELTNLISAINEVAFILELDIDGNIVTVPERLAKTFSVENSEIIGHHISEFDYNAKTELSELNFWQELLEGHTKKYRLKYVKGSQDFWLNVFIVPFTDKAGEVSKFISVLIDVTEQVGANMDLLNQTNELQIKEQEIKKKIEQLQELSEQAINEKAEAEKLAKKLELSEDVLKRALEKNKEQLKNNEQLVADIKHQADQFKLLFENSSNAIQLLHQGKFIDCNIPTLELFGYKSKEEFTGTPPGKLSPSQQPDGQDSMQKAEQMIQKAVETGSNTFEWTHVKKDGTEFPARVTLVSYKQGEEIYLYALVEDKSAEAQLTSLGKKYKEEAEKYLNRARKFREKLEKLDILLEQKDAEIFVLKKKLEEGNK